ncbi:MAG TPA: glycosyltransferase family A protein [Anaerolineales bacterium]|nr:glycosyltransferase family A protein [Anaerolineales bacterium]
MFCSTIIPTIDRRTLSRAVESILKQNIPHSEFEILVINDSGMPLERADWQSSERVQIIQTNRRERSVARNTGAAIAKGTYLHFLDDDDWLVPNAYQHFWELSQVSNAKWLYGMTQLVDRQGRPTIKLRHSLNGNCFVQAMAGEWIPLQASLIERKTFLEIGGFNPLLTGPEDIDLLRRILRTEDVCETPNLVAYVIMGGEGSTTDYVQHPQASRWAREMLLDSSNVHDRMRSSAVNSFWCGRMLRVYLTSVVWNLAHRRFFSAASRIWSSIFALLHAGTGVLTKDFWRAVSRPYASITFENGIQQSRLGK